MCSLFLAFVISSSTLRCQRLGLQHYHTRLKICLGAFKALSIQPVLQACPILAQGPRQAESILTALGQSCRAEALIIQSHRSVPKDAPEPFSGRSQQVGPCKRHQSA